MTHDIYAIGDIHGRFDLLKKALATIERETTAATVVFLGDYIDRGPDSKPVVETLMRGPTRPGDRWICLKGNHEAMACDAAAGRDRFLWLDNGGDATLRSFGGALPPAVLAWFAALPVTFETEHHLFVHAGIFPGVPIDQQSDDTMLWIRDRFLDDNRLHEKHIVHGHTPSYEVELRPNRTNLDTMAFRTGRLTIGRFDRRTKLGPEEVMTIMA
ncbi:MAG TPA: metallophosphoesterase family protein [Candidatus Cybelea sp.]|nr:metallophosphoesterase family protein [Candidatus Cybelea sp.]